MTIFDILTDIIKNKTGSLCNDSEFDKTFQNFMINRYLSMRQEFLENLCECIKLQDNLSKEQYYKLLVKSIPYSSNSYCNYIKKAKKE